MKTFENQPKTEPYAMEDKDIKIISNHSNKTISALSKHNTEGSKTETFVLLNSDATANNNNNNSTKSINNNISNRSHQNSTDESKKIAKPAFQNFTKHSKAAIQTKTINSTDVKINSIIEKGILQYITSTKSNKIIEKHVPVSNPDPTSYSSILKKIDSDQQIKKGKVTIDENLNLEHLLTNSDISSIHSVAEKKEERVNKMIEKEVQDNVTNKAEESSNIISVNNEHSQKKVSYLECHSELLKSSMNQNSDLEDTYIPITEMGFSLNNELEKRNINSEKFYEHVFKDFDPNIKIIKYAQLSIEDWLKKGEKINEERAKLTKQIMSIRIRSSYAHLILTEHINARANALQKWEQQQKSNEAILVKIQSFLEKKT